MSIETLIWIAIALAIGGFVWITAPHHTRLIDAAHERLKDQDAAKV